jgi:hypothetical protein
LDGCLAECLLHTWTEDSHHHLFERTKESPVVPAQDVVRRIPKCLQAFLFFLLGGGIALPWQQHPGHLIFQVRDATSILLEGQQTLLLELVHDILELLPLFRREVLNVDIHNIHDVRHLDFSAVVPLGVPKSVLTQNVHLAPNTQQAEQAVFTRAKNHKTCQSIFLKKLTKDNVVKHQSLELAGWYQTVPYLRLQSQMG